VDCLKNMSFDSFVVGTDACQDSHYTGLWCPLNYSMLTVYGKKNIYIYIIK